MRGTRGVHKGGEGYMRGTRGVHGGGVHEGYTRGTSGGVHEGYIRGTFFFYVELLIHFFLC